MNTGSTQQQSIRIDLSKVDLAELSKQISRSFSVDELRQFCLELEVDYDNLEGATKNTKALSLTTFFGRRNRLKELIIACIRKRPNLWWSGMTVVNVPSTGTRSAQGSSQQDADSWWNDAKDYIIGGLVLLAAFLLFLLYQRSSGLDRYLTVVSEYSFADLSQFQNIRNAKQEHVTAIGRSDADHSDPYLQMQLSFPEAALGVENFQSGGICVPWEKDMPIDAVSAIVRAPEGVYSLSSWFVVGVGGQSFMSKSVNLEPDKWTPNIWGTKFYHVIDNEKITWDGKGAGEVCLFIGTNQPYSGFVQIDDLTIYQTKQYDD